MCKAWKGLICLPNAVLPALPCLCPACTHPLPSISKTEGEGEM